MTTRKGLEGWGGVTEQLVSVASAIRACRLRAGFSARQLSQQAGLSPSYVGKIEAGEIGLSLRAFGRIANALRMSAQEVSFCVAIAAHDVNGETVTPPN